jgi:hypothetical protein
MEQDEVARRARAAGLVRYLETEPEQLGAALRAAADLARRLPKDFTPAEEPAHTLKLSPMEGRP